MKSITDRLDVWSLRPVAVTGVSGTRVLLGFVGLMYYVSQYQERNYLFGPDGVLPYEDFKAQLTGFSLYTLSASPWYFQLVYHLGIAAALAVMLGVGGGPDSPCTGPCCGRSTSGSPASWTAATTSRTSSSPSCC
ncbi:hypothetical protein ACFQV4_14160 [Streptomyces thermocarboxydus]